MRMAEMQMEYQFKVAEHEMKMAELQAKMQASSVAHEQKAEQTGLAMMQQGMTE
jgi:hypothetical protein